MEIIRTENPIKSRIFKEGQSDGDRYHPYTWENHWALHYRTEIPMALLSEGEEVRIAFGNIKMLVEYVYRRRAAINYTKLGEKLRNILITINEIDQNIEVDKKHYRGSRNE